MNQGARGEHAQHIRHIHLNGDHHNNNGKANGEIRDREKTMRGIKKADSEILTATSSTTIISENTKG